MKRKIAVVAVLALLVGTTAAMADRGGFVVQRPNLFDGQIRLFLGLFSELSDDQRVAIGLVEDRAFKQGGIYEGCLVNQRPQ